LRKISPTSLFIYALGVTALAFASKNIYSLLLIGIINGVPGLILSLKKYKLIAILLAIGVWGTFINAVLVSNYGFTVLEIGPLVVNSGALIATLMISLRLLGIAGGALIFLSLAKPREIIKSLEEELGMPKGIAFATSFAIRLLSLMRKDYREIQSIRIERGFRKYPLTPSDIKSLLLPLLSLGYERGIWVGIAAELRGFSLRKTRRKGLKLGSKEAFIYIALITQSIAVIALQIFFSS
jgi:energy-coupling factor transport system permease protein